MEAVGVSGKSLLNPGFCTDDAVCIRNLKAALCIPHICTHERGYTYMIVTRPRFVQQYISYIRHTPTHDLRTQCVVIFCMLCISRYKS